MLWRKSQDLVRLTTRSHFLVAVLTSEEDVLRYAMCGSLHEIWKPDSAPCFHKVCPLGECLAFACLARDKCARMFWQTAHRNEIRPVVPSTAEYTHSHRVLCWLLNLCKPDNAWLVQGATLRDPFIRFPLPNTPVLFSLSLCPFTVDLCYRIHSFCHSTFHLILKMFYLLMLAYRSGNIHWLVCNQNIVLRESSSN